MFEPALEQITKTEAGPIETFITKLQEKLDEKLDNGHPPDAPTLADIVERIAMARPLSSSAAYQWSISRNMKTDLRPCGECCSGCPVKPLSLTPAARHG